MLDAHAGDVSEADKARVRQNLATDLARAEDAFATYRATPLAVERAVGDKYKDIWPSYVAGTRKVIESVDAGDLAQARIRLNALSVDVFIHAREHLRGMIDSNKRQIKESAEGAQELETSSTLILLVGIVNPATKPQKRQSPE